jgi:hypothetical protein
MRATRAACPSAGDDVEVEGRRDGHDGSQIGHGSGSETD